jgi:predicted helicase
MACGTGKSFTSLKITEKELNSHVLVLFFALSLALISQVLLEWSNNASKPLFSICICSNQDVSIVKRKNCQDEAMEIEADLALSATTSVTNIIKQLNFT